MYPLIHIQAAYANTGLIPCIGDWGDPETGTACPIVALCINKRDNIGTNADPRYDWQSLDQYSALDTVCELLNTSIEEVAAFMAGVDDQPCLSVLYGELYDYGRQAREWIIAEMELYNLSLNKTTNTGTIA